MKYKIILGSLVSFILVPGVSFATSPLAGVNSWIEHQLSSNNASIGSYLYLLLGGILASLLPCTYPLYPITVNILKNREGTQKRFMHPLFYFLGIAGIYFIFGIIASFTGGAFNTILRLPITNLIIASCIFILGLSSLDLLYLPIFSGNSGDGQSKGIWGTFLMGMGAGLLSSACVGPVVVSILVGIASQNGSFSAILGFIAASKMLLFGIGIGLPFLLMGVFGMSLPKSGKWMKYIQVALGLVIIYFAYLYLEKSLLGFGFSEEIITLISISGGTVLLSVYLFQPSTILAHERMKRALLVVSGMVGMLILTSALFSKIGQTSNSEPYILKKTSDKTEQKGNLTWFLNKADAYKEAKERNKPIFIDFHADWCTNCKEFQKITQSNVSLNEALKGAVLLKIYEGTPEFLAYSSDVRFPELKVGLPFFIITDKEEHLLYKTNDYLKTEEITLFLTN